MYQVFGVTKNGDGYCQDLGMYEDVEDIRIYSDALKDGISIEIEYLGPKQFAHKYQEFSDEIKKYIDNL